MPSQIILPDVQDLSNLELLEHCPFCSGCSKTSDAADADEANQSRGDGKYNLDVHSSSSTVGEREHLSASFQDLQNEESLHESNKSKHGRIRMLGQKIKDSLLSASIAFAGGQDGSHGRLLLKAGAVGIISVITYKLLSAKVMKPGHPVGSAVQGLWEEVKRAALERFPIVAKASCQFLEA